MTLLNCCFFLLVASIDLRCRLIPNALVYPAAAATLLVHAPSPGVGLPMALLGGVFRLAPFLLAALLRPGDLGGGDVKLATLIGLVLWALGVGVLAGGITAVVLLLHPGWERQSQIPYAPFLCTGAIVALLYNPLSTLFPL